MIQKLPSVHTFEINSAHSCFLVLFETSTTTLEIALKIKLTSRKLKSTLDREGKGRLIK
jgi:hypothetical protein